MRSLTSWLGLLFGCGVIGVSAQEKTPIRITHATAEFGYGRAAREATSNHGMSAGLADEIPFPGLAESQSQVAVPILADERVLGVLFAESTESHRFGYDEEDALAVLAGFIGTAAQACDATAEVADEAAIPVPRVAAPGGPAMRIRRYA